jgi:4-diphosphocytidyl-2-C-methyl-D-erythritol kinase
VTGDADFDPGRSSPATAVAANRLVTPVVRVAPAKLNLTLSVGGRRPDGFHDLHSVMVPLGLADRLSVAPAQGEQDTLHVDGDDGPPRADDLVLRGIAAARRAARASLGPAADAFPLAARLDKRIPIAAGLAGGSSDAAAAIEAALEAWGIRLAGAERIAAAIAVGSDVPFFLAAGPALVEGRGERLTVLRPPKGNVGVLVVTPALAVSTTEVFRRFDAGGDAAPSDPRSTRISSEHLAQELGAGLAADQLVVRAGILATANDLINATALVVPELRAFRRSLARRLGRPVGQSGSGPTLWALYPSIAEAEAAGSELASGLGDGSLVAPGDGPPRIHATTIAATSTSPTAPEARSES